MSETYEERAQVAENKLAILKKSFDEVVKALENMVAKHDCGSGNCNACNGATIVLDSVKEVRV